MSVVTRERTIEPPLDSSTNSAQLSVVHVCAVHICKCSLHVGVCAEQSAHGFVTGEQECIVHNIYV